jgi:hypothetical protein
MIQSMYMKFWIGLVVFLWVIMPHDTFAAPIVAGSFSTTWDNSGGDGDPNDPVSIILGVCADAVYWEEIGNPSNSSTTFSCVGEGGTQTQVTFPSSGNYRVDFSGNFTTINLVNGVNRGYFRSVEQWGDSVWTDLFGAFQSVHRLAINAADAPDLSQVTNFSYLFAGATNFNSNINHWNVSTITEMAGVFNGASSFNQPLDNWDVSNVVNFGGGEEGGMFEGASSFNQSLNSWNVFKGESFVNMFRSATAFNQPLDNWNFRSSCIILVQNEEDRFFVFDWLFPVAYAGPDTCINMSGMFRDASSFDQSLASWTISGVQQMNNMLDNSGLSTEHYSATLQSWATQPVNNLVTLGAAGLVYTDAATAARDELIDVHFWTIDGDVLFVEPGSETFTTRWDTSLDPLTPNNLTIYGGEGEGPFTIDWGDGTSQYYPSGPGDYLTHTYSTPGIKTVTITGTFPYFYAGCYDGDAYNKLIDVTQWGTGVWESFNTSFAGCTHLTGFSASDVPNLSQVTDMAEAFGGATAFNGDIGDWDVSNVSEMTNMFSGATSFNGDISGWDVTNVDYMQSMFNGASSFNQDISGWDVSPIDMYTMFNNASNFNQDISGWDVTTLAQSGYALAGSGISTSNYTKLLLGWSTQILPDNVGPGPIGGTYDSDLGDYINLTPYCTSAQSARDVITGTYNWSITDGGSVPCKTVTYIADAGGALVGDVFQYIADGESGTAVTATPAEGFRFVSWSDGSTQNPRTDSSLSSNLTLTAVFASTGGDSDSTKIGLRAERLLDVLSEVPVIGSIATFVTSVRDFLNYLTEHEAEIEKLTPEERTKVITTLRDIIAFLLKFVPGV